MSELATYLAQYYRVLEYIAAATAVIILISSLDDLFIDAWYWTREIYRKLTVKRDVNYKPLTAEVLREQPQKPLAIMVPAWLEYDVIAQMIENMVSVLDYRSYVVFVGTYINDKETIHEVERMRRRYRQLKRVEVPHAGPTCKADCLNWLIQAIFKYEQDENTEFAGVILHDSEDVLHPLELQFFNYLLPRKDMIQLPVMSLERNWYELIAGTYMDEFAEWHAKDLVVRESVTGMVPSAGVGTCFSRRALFALIEKNQNQPFNTDSLTEDYDVGARLGALGMQSIFARFNVQFRAKRESWFGHGKMRELILDIPLCVREYFPDTLRTAYRQKARWVLGISMQSWEQMGWEGSLATKYLLFRDRKGIITSFASILAYLLLFQFVLFYLAGLAGWWTMRFPPLFSESDTLMLVVDMTAVSLVLRVVQRFYFVTKLYGWEHGLMSMPRMLVGNLINFLAVSRAWRLFLGHLLFGHRMVWDKTMHEFPSSDQLKQTHVRLGELLTSWQVVDNSQLEEAMSDQKERQMPLGHILIAKGWLDDETLAEAISFQTNLPRAHPDEAMIKEHADLLPQDMRVRWRALAIGQHEQELRIAIANVLSEEALQQIQTETGCTVAQYVVRESEIRSGLRLLSSDTAMPNSNKVPLLGDILIESNLISRKDFELALMQYRPDRDGRIGDYLVNRGVVSADSIAQAMQEQARQTQQLLASANTAESANDSVAVAKTAKDAT